MTADKEFDQYTTEKLGNNTRSPEQPILPLHKVVIILSAPIITELRKQISANGYPTIASFARAIKISPSYMHQLLGGYMPLRLHIQERIEQILDWKLPLWGVISPTSVHA